MSFIAFDDEKLAFYSDCTAECVWAPAECAGAPAECAEAPAECAGAPAECAEMSCVIIN